jgi:hypothetical protein
VLDDDQGIDAAEQHGVHVDEVGGDDAAGLGKELLPGRAGAAGRGIDPGVVQDLPDRGGRDRVAEPGPKTTTSNLSTRQNYLYTLGLTIPEILRRRGSPESPGL